MQKNYKIFISSFTWLLVSIFIASQSVCWAVCLEEKIVLQYKYTGACGYTQNTSFTLSEELYITRIAAWYDTNVSTENLSAVLNGPDGYIKILNSTTKGVCQWSWCEGIWNLNEILKPGTYTLTADNNSICANPSGLTTLTLYGCTAAEQEQPKIIVLTDSNRNAAIPSGTSSQIYGCNSGINNVTIESGASAKLINFPGNNLITVKSDSGSFTVSRSGATVTLQNITDGTLLVMPATKTAQSVIFNDRTINLVISAGKGMLGNQIVTLDPASIQAVPSINIIDYFPQSGPSGSYVFLKLEAPISNLVENIKVLYNQQEVENISILQKEADILRFTVPDGAQSGDIQVKAGDSLSNNVYFTVLETVITPLASKSVSPSSVDQIVNYKDEVSVTIPPGILDTTRTLSISRIENVRADSTAPFAELSAFDVNINGLEQLDGYIEITVKYNPDLVNPEYSAEEQLIAMRWNEQDNFWLPLPYKVNAQNQTLSFYTDHLSMFVFGSIGVMIATIPVTWAGEKLLNNVYVTPEGNFRLLYSKSWIEADVTLENYTWINTTYKNPFYPISSYQTGHPKCIQDIGNLLEAALKNYVSAYNFQNPVSLPVVFGGKPSNPITVKIDSLWVLMPVIGGNPNYEKIWENIHLPTDNLKDFYTHDSYATLGHELFHRIQAEYYKKYGMIYQGKSFWWIEAAAEYAGNRVAWADKKLLNNSNAETGSNFFTYPISTTGVIGNIKGWGASREYQYAASAFVQFLVEKQGLNFKDMIEYVAQGNPLERLDGYNGLDLAQSYRDFAAWGIFGDDSFLKKYSVSEIVEKNETVNLVEKTTFKISFTGGNNSSVDIYKFDKKYERTSTVPASVSNIENGDIYAFDADEQVFLYLLATNTGDIDETLNVSVKAFVDGEEQKDFEKKYTFDLKGGYSARLWTIEINNKIPTLTITPNEILDGKADQEYTFQFIAENIPDSIQNVYFEFDFGDYQSHSTGKSDVIAVSGGKAEFEISYTYPSGINECTINVNLKDLKEVLSDKKLAQSAAKIYFHTVTIQGARIVIYELQDNQNEITETFEAIALPDGIYRFDWDFGDGSKFSEVKQAGEKSKVSHTYTGLKDGDKFNVSVSIYSQTGELFATDKILLSIESQSNEHLCNGEEVDYSQLTKVEYQNLLYYRNTDGQSHGFYQEWYDALRTKLWRQGLYCNGKKNGIWTYCWQDTGNKYQEVSYIDDIRNGIWVEWDKDGNKIKEGNYLNDKETGIWTWWYENGNKADEGSYTNGLQTGLWTSWYENGFKKAEGNYTNGGQSGLWAYWHENGSCHYVYDYDNMTMISVGSGCP
ncbi:MAG: toxin-antitoxin system YwqK family antitoxin [Desulfamplus sp.]